MQLPPRELQKLGGGSMYRCFGCQNHLVWAMRVMKVH